MRRGSLDAARSFRNQQCNSRHHHTLSIDQIVKVDYSKIKNAKSPSKVPHSPEEHVPHH